MTEFSRDEALRELWTRGDLDWRLEPHQKELINLMRSEDVEIVYLDLTRRGGKTDLLVTYFNEVCIKNPGTVARYGAATQKDLLRFILPTFENVLSTCPEDLKPRYMTSGQTYHYANGSEIGLVGLDLNPDGLRGNGIFLIGLDEAGFVDKLEYIYKSVIIPATARRKHQAGRKIKIIIATTPPVDATEHFAFQLKLKAETQENGIYRKLTMDEIESVSDEEKQRLYDEVGGINSITCQREFFCKWIVDEERAVCSSFDETKHVKAFDLPPPHTTWTFAGDTGGVQDKTVGLMACWSHELKKVLFWDEQCYDSHTPSTTVLAGFKDMEQRYHDDDKRPRKTTRWLDAAGQLLVDYAAAGFGASLPPKDDFDAGLLLLRNSFFKDEVLIHPRCKLLIATLRSGLLNNQRTDYSRTKSLGHCDAAAAAIYALRVVDRVSDKRVEERDENVRYAKKKKIKHGLAQLGYRGNHG